MKQALGSPGILWQTDRLPRLDLRAPVRAGLLVLALAVGGALLMLARAPLDRADALAEITVVRDKLYDVRHPYGGAVGRIMVSEGQDVAAGDVIATLDTAAVDAQIAALKAQSATVERQLDLVRREVQGYNELVENRRVSRIKLAALESLVADLERDAADFLLRIARAEQQLSHVEVRAPVGGRVALAPTLAGSIEPGALIASIAPPPGRLVLEGPVAPAHSGAMRVGQEIRVWLYALSWMQGRSSVARIAWISPDAMADHVAVRLEVDIGRSALQARLVTLPVLGGGLVLRDDQQTLLGQLLGPIRQNFTRAPAPDLSELKS